MRTTYAADVDAEAGTTTPAGSPLSRRRLLALMGAGAGALTLAACGGGGSSTASTSGTTPTSAGSSSAATTATTTAGTTSGSGASSSAAGAALASIPDETAGPYPGDGSNGPNVLTQDGIVRQDIRSSFGSSGTTAGGVPLTIRLTVQDGATPLAGAAVYLWHCDASGRYSMYGNGVTDEDYLRGVQVADGRGELSFTSIFPAAYSGRWPHIHFKVYSSVDDATGGAKAIKTSQLALPEDVCDAVYEQGGYDASTRNLASTSLDRDMVFSDGCSLQMATVTGDVRSGLTASLAFSV